MNIVKRWKMEDNELRNTDRGWLGIIAFFLMLLMLWVMGGCKSSKVVSERETRDSVVYTYKTVWRDSVRRRDSVVLIYETVVRDSVVAKVDKETGEVLSTDRWHWEGTNKDRSRVRDGLETAFKGETRAREAVKSDSGVMVRTGTGTPAREKKKAREREEKALCGQRLPVGVVLMIVAISLWGCWKLRGVFPKLGG